MTKSLEQLKKERNALLRKTKARESLDSLSRARNLERKKVMAEISALKRPGSKMALESFKSKSKSLGKFLKKRIDIVSENLESMERQEARRKRPVKKSPQRKRPTTSRRVGRR